MARIKDRPQDPNIDLLDRFDRTRTSDDSDVGHTAQDLINFINNNITANAKIAASAETTLNNAGDFFDFDVSALTPPVSGRQVIPVVLEKGTAGGELFAQEKLWDFDFGVQTGKYAGVTDVNDITAYLIPDSDNRIFKLNKENKTVDQLDIVVPGGAIRKYLGQYNQKSNKIFCTPIFATNIGVLNLEDETFYTFGSFASLSIGTNAVQSSEGNFYIFNFNSSGLATINKFMPDVNGTSETLTTIATASGATTNSFHSGIIVHNNKAYFYPTQNLPNAILVYNFDTEAFEASIPISYQGWSTAIKVGDNVYVSNQNPAFVVNPRFMKHNLTTNTITYYNVPQQGYIGGNYIEETNEVFFYPRAATGLAVWDVATDNITFRGNITGVTSGVLHKNGIITAPGNNRRIVEFAILPPFAANPANPLPYFSVANQFTTSGNTNRLASLEDYNVEFTEDGSGNITNIRTTMLTEGAKNVTLNLVYSGF